MAAKYDFKTSPDIQGEKEQPTLYPQIVVSGTKNLKDLAKDIARRSTVHEGTVVGPLPCGKSVWPRMCPVLPVLRYNRLPGNWR